jgi:hypothetical protein
MRAWKARNKTALTIFVHPRIEQSGFGPQLRTAAGYSACPHCRLVSNPNKAHVRLYHLRPPQGDVARNPSTVHAAFNLEAHSPPPPGQNTILISYHRESDVVVAYGLLGPFKRLCTVDLSPLDAPPPSPGGPSPRNPVCANRTAPPPSAFARWSLSDHGGDFLAAVFGLLPRFAAAAGPSFAARPFAAVWMSASCGRHGNFLARLMRHVPVDSMGACFRSRDERAHPARRLMKGSGMWWGAEELPVRSGELKMVLASHYAFYISVENTIADDYVTEKFYQVSPGGAGGLRACAHTQTHAHTHTHTHT